MTCQNGHWHLHVVYYSILFVFCLLLAVIGTAWRKEYIYQQTVRITWKFMSNSTFSMLLRAYWTYHWKIYKVNTSISLWLNCCRLYISVIRSQKPKWTMTITPWGAMVTSQLDFSFIVVDFRGRSLVWL